MRALLFIAALVFAAAAGGVDFPNTLDRSGIQVLCKSAVAVTAPGDTNENTLATCTVPAGAIGANGVLRIHTLFSHTNNANNKTYRVRYSGGAGTQYVGTATASTAWISFTTLIAARNATNSQVGDSIGMTSAGGVVGAQATSAVDTTAATTIVVTGQKATAGDTMTFESVLVELLPAN